MNKLKLTNYQISIEVDAALQRNNWSVRTCCNEFNQLNQKQISLREMKKLDKDFIQRIRKNKFSVVTKRVIDFCEFLKIDIHASSHDEKPYFKQELSVFENAIKINPQLESKIRNLLKNVAEIAFLGDNYK